MHWKVFSQTVNQPIGVSGTQMTSTNTQLTDRHPIERAWANAQWRVAVEDDGVALLHDNGRRRLLGKLGRALQTKRHSMEESHEKSIFSEFAKCISSNLILGLLTWSHQLNLLRHCGAKLIGSVAPVFALRSNQVLVWNHNSSIFVFVAPCCDIWLLDFFPIFCPPVSNGGENNVCHESLPQRWTLFAPMPLVLTLVAGFLLLHTQLLHFGGKEVR